MQTALKMAKGSLEMLGRRAQPHEEGDAKSDGGSKGASPEGKGKGDGGKSKSKGKSPEGKDAKSKKSPEDKGGKGKGDKRADLAKAHETKAALKEKFWNSNSNNEGAEAEKVWTGRQVRKCPLAAHDLKMAGMFEIFRKMRGTQLGTCLNHRAFGRTKGNLLLLATTMTS